MILRLATNAAIHTAGGVALGVTAALAACTVAQIVQRGVQQQRKRGSDFDDLAPNPSDPKPTDPRTL